MIDIRVLQDGGYAAFGVPDDVVKQVSLLFQSRRLQCDLIDKYGSLDVVAVDQELVNIVRAAPAEIRKIDEEVVRLLTPYAEVKESS